MIPRRSRQKITRYSSLTHRPFNENVKENTIVEIDNYKDWVEFNSNNEKIPCYKVIGKDGEEYLVSKAFEGQISFCDAIQYRATPTASIFMGDYLVNTATGESSDQGFTWVPIVKRWANGRG